MDQLPPNVEVIKSRAISILFTIIRNKNTTNQQYVLYCDRLCRLLAEEALACFAMENKNNLIEIETPCGKWKGYSPLNNNLLCCVSILRSGDILLEAVRNIVPGLSVGKILIQRDESSKEKNAKHFYTKLPNHINKMKVLLVDPMLATGGSALSAIKILIDQGCKEENIIFLNTISAPEGLWNVSKKYSKIRILTAAVDEKLNEHKFIVPGLGDFGDRYYQTGHNSLELLDEKMIYKNNQSKILFM